MEKYGYTSLQVGCDGSEVDDSLPNGEEGSFSTQDGADQGSCWPGELPSLEVA